MSEIFQKDVCNAFKNIGAKDGDIVVFHSSLKSMGHVNGGPLAVINGALDAVGSNGTVAIPTLWWDGAAEKTPDKFDLKNSPAYNGAIADAMRQDPRSYRSNHYSHSLSAIGAKAAELTSEHGTGKLYPDPWNETAFSENSPWTKLYNYDALYCFIGCTLNVCTIKHRIEGEFIQEQLDKLPIELRDEFRQKLHYKRKYTFWANFDIEKMQELFIAEGTVLQTKLGDTQLIGVRTQTLFKRVKELLYAEPEKWFLNPDFPNFMKELDKVKNELKKL